MKINDCITQLNAAQLALESAPQTGFVDLDKVKQSLAAGAEFLTKVSPRLELGEKLLDDFRQKLLAKVKTLKACNGGILAGQAESFLQADNPEYEKLMALNEEIDGALKRIFSRRTKIPSASANIANNSSLHLDDYR